MFVLTGCWDLRRKECCAHLRSQFLAAHSWEAEICHQQIERATAARQQFERLLAGADARHRAAKLLEHVSGRHAQHDLVFDQ